MEVKKPRNCQRQRFRLNAVGTANLSQEEAAEEYFRINTTIPFLDQVLSRMKARFEDGQSLVQYLFLHVLSQRRIGSLRYSHVLICIVMSK